MTVLISETVRQQFRHEVRVVHATTGKPITGFRAALVHPRRPGWTISKSGHRVIVSVLERHDDVAIIPEIDIEVTDPATKTRLAPFGAPAGTVRPELHHRQTVTLMAAVVTVALQPAPASLHLEIIDRDGAALTGRTVELHGSAGVTLPLAETVGGVYQALDQVWPPELATADVVIDAVVHDRPLAIDPAQRNLRVRYIHT